MVPIGAMRVSSVLYSSKIVKVNRLFSRRIHLWGNLAGEANVKYLTNDPLLDLTVKRDNFDVVIVGGGIIGLATAREILRRDPKRTVVVLEKEREVAAHQSGHNSGVIHAGLYYKPGSSMAHTCVRGAELMYKYCEEHHLPIDRCGKLIVGVDKKEHEEHVVRLFNQGNANGVQGLELIYGDKITEMEPNIKGYSALWSPNTGIADFGAVCRHMAKEIVESGRGEIRVAFEAKKFEYKDGKVKIYGTEPGLDGPVVHVKGKNVITCAGFYADRVAKLTGGDYGLAKIVTFRGSYYQMKPEYKAVVKTNVYPVPSGGGIPVGVHFTPTVNIRRGMQTIVGPGACITFSREGYKFFDFNIRDLYDSLLNTNFWVFALKNLELSLGELYRDLNKKAFLRSAQKMMPSLTLDMVEESFAGVMTQVFESRGIAASDYILERKVMHNTTLNVRNAPSPASTGSLAIAEMVVDVANKDFGWGLAYSGSPASEKLLQN